MLIRFEVQNFLSFREKVSFNMLPTTASNFPSHVVSPVDNLRLLRGATMYGANGSGKSNFIAAVDFLRNLVSKGTPDYRSKIPLRPFKLDVTWLRRPSSFVIEFAKNGAVYRYEIELFENVITQETLSKLKKDRDFEIIFDRSRTDRGKTNLKFGQEILEPSSANTRKRIYENELRENQPFFYDGANRKISQILEPHTWFHDNLNTVTPDSVPSELMETLFKGPFEIERTSRLLRSADTGVHGLKFEKVALEAALGYLNPEQRELLISELSKVSSRSIRTKDGSIYEIYVDKATGEPQANRLMTQHIGEGNLPVDFEIYEESDGTRRFIDVLPALLLTSEGENVFLIDEIERSLHPLLIKKMIQFFFEGRQLKPRGQLIFTTHEVLLLDNSMFQADEIWLFNKAKSGSSELYSVSDFKKKYGDNIMKAYLRGDFGAVPSLSTTNPLEG